MDKTLNLLVRDLPSSSEGREGIDPAFDVLAAMRRAGFPSKFLRDDWKTPEFVKRYEPPMVSQEFRDFRGLFLVGATGRKKTATLCLMARDWMRRIGRRGSKAWGFVSFPDLCLQLQESWESGVGGPRKIINQISSIPILIIDDIGVEKTTDFVLQSAYLILNKREQAELPTYGTSNLTIGQIKEKLDDRIASRIEGMCEVLIVGGEDQRGKRQ